MKTSLRQFICNTLLFNVNKIKHVFDSTTNDKIELKNKVLEQKLGRTLSEVCCAIIDNNYEEAIATFSKDCIGQNVDLAEQQFLDHFLCRRVVSERLTKAKSRYYEFFLSLVSPSKRRDFSKQLYPGISEEQLDYVRRMLSLGKHHELHNKDFFVERILEWGLIFDEAEIPYLTKEILFEQFEKRSVETDEDLFQTLIEITPLYFLRKLQLPTLLDFHNLLKVLPLIEGNKIPLKTLEYGCGAADLSIFLAQIGHKPTLCDVQGGNLDAARKRFDLRSLDVSCIGVDAINPIPSIEHNFDLIIAIEVLEHIRDPFSLLRLIDKSVNDRGIIMLGSFPFTETTATGDHLIEAVSLRNELLCWINDNWQRVDVENVGNTFMKKLP